MQIQDRAELRDNDTVEALRISEAQSRRRLAEIEAIYDSAPIALCVLDTELRYVRLNRRLAEINRLPVEAHIGRSIREILPEVIVNQVEPAFRRVLDTGEHLPGLEVRGFSPVDQSTTRCLTLAAVPLKDEHGQLLGISVSAEDITERKRAEEALRESEERFRVAQELSPDGFLIFRPLRDSTGAVTDFLWMYENDAAARMNDTKPKEVCGKRVSDVLPHHDKSPFHKAYKEVAETGEVRVVEEALYDQDTFRQRRWFRVAAVPTTRGDVAILVQDVTERKKAEEALRESHERMEKVLEVETVGVMFWDLNTGSMVDANDTFLKLMGYSRRQVEAGELTWQKLTPPDYMDVSRREIEKFLATGRVGPYEKEYFCQDGTRKWLLFAGSSLGNNQCAEFCVDISERKKAEEALRESEERLAAVTENLNESLIIGDSQGRVIHWNAAALTMFGYESLDECVRKLAEFADTFEIRPLNEDRLLPVADWPMSRVLRGEVLRDWEVRLRRPDQGWEKIAAFSGSLIRSAGGEMLAFISATDITERKRTEKALQESEERLRLAQQAAGIGTFEWDLDKQVTVWSPELAARYGLPPGPIWRRYEEWASQVHPEDLPEAEQQIQRALDTGLFESEWRVVWPDGTVRWMAARGQVFKDEAGKPVRMLGVNLDITDRKRAEERLGAVMAAQREIASANLDYAGLRELILERTSRLLGADGACLEIAEGGEMVYEAATGIASGFVGLRLKSAGSLSGLCMASNQLLRSDDTENDPRVDRAACRRIGLRSMILIPLQYDEHLLGVLKLMSVRAAAFSADDADSLRLMGEFLGVTIARQRALAALSESEARYREREARMRAVFRSLVEGIVFLNRNGEVEEMNESVERLHGHRLEEHADPESDSRGGIIRTDGTLFPVDEQPGIVALRTGQPVRDVEMGVPVRDGSVKWRLVNAQPVRDGQGNLLGAVASFFDITDRKRAENRLRRFFDTDLFAILYWKINGGVIDANDKFLEMTGYTREDLRAGRLNWSEMTPPEYHALDEDARRQVRETGVHRPYEKEYMRKDGTRVWGLFAAAAWEDNRDEGVSFIVDITERKRAEERLRHSQKLESIGLLAGGVAHDFNNILTGVIGNTSLALEQVDPDTGKILQSVMTQAERAAHLTRQLLAYAGKGQFFLQDLNVSNSLSEMAEFLRLSVPKTVEMKFDLRDRLPLIEMDAGQLQQVVMNLVINAGEAVQQRRIPHGSVFISTGSRHISEPFTDAAGHDVASGRYVCIEVTDNGAGMDDATKAKVFDPFFTTKFMGRGLGLAAVSGIMRAVNGGLTLDTAPGRGTTFRLLFPAKEGSSADTSTNEPCNDGRRTVLVVDDEAPVREFISKALERRDYRVLVAADGSDALSVWDYKSDCIDLVILDVVLPTVGGAEVLAEFQRRRPDVPVLLTSGFNETEARRLCSGHGRVEFLQKPYTARTLTERVEACLTSASSRRN